VGLEPTLAEANTALNRARLPIPPLRQRNSHAWYQGTPRPSRRRPDLPPGARFAGGAGGVMQVACRWGQILNLLMQVVQVGSDLESAHAWVGAQPLGARAVGVPGRLLARLPARLVHALASERPGRLPGRAHCPYRRPLGARSVGVPAGGRSLSKQYRAGWQPIHQLTESRCVSSALPRHAPCLKMVWERGRSRR